MNLTAATTGGAGRDRADMWPRVLFSKHTPVGAVWTLPPFGRVRWCVAARSPVKPTRSFVARGRALRVDRRSSATPTRKNESPDPEQENKMIITLSSPKSGNGVTVTAALLALTASISQHTTIVDLAGDQLSALGVTAVGHRQIEVTAQLTVIDAATDTTDEQHRQITECETQGELVIIDAGRADHPIHDLLDADTRRLWVLRCCYLTLRRAASATYRPDEIIMVREPQRALHERDVEQALGVKVTAIIDLDPGIARAVDAGLLAARPPRHASAALRHLLQPTLEAKAS
jgi:hypothetical protein